MDKIGTVTYENRVFMHNLSYDCDEEDIKNWLKAMKDVEPLSVSMLTNPRVNKPSGAAYVTLTNESDLEAVISLDCQEFNGRKLFINKDHDNFHLKRFVEKIGGLSFKLDEYGDPVIRFCGLFLVKVGHTYDAQDISGPQMFSCQVASKSISVLELGI